MNLSFSTNNIFIFIYFLFSLTCSLGSYGHNESYPLCIVPFDIFPHSYSVIPAEAGIYLSFLSHGLCGHGSSCPYSYIFALFQANTRFAFTYINKQLSCQLTLLKQKMHLKLSRCIKAKVLINIFYFYILYTLLISFNYFINLWFYHHNLWFINHKSVCHIYFYFVGVGFIRPELFGYFFNGFDESNP